MDTNKILNISSNYSRRILFSYLEYDNIIRLIKYNKNLQNKLGIKIMNKKNYIIKEENKSDSYHLENNFTYIIVSLFIFYISFSFVLGLIEIGFFTYFFFSLLFSALNYALEYYINVKNIYKLNTITSFFYAIIIYIPFFKKHLIFIYSCLPIIFLHIIAYLFFPKHGKTYKSLREFKIKRCFILIISFLVLICKRFKLIYLKNTGFSIIIYIYFLYNCIYYYYLFHVVVVELFFNSNNYIPKSILLEYKDVKIKPYYLHRFKQIRNKEKFLKGIAKNFNVIHSNEELLIFSKINNLRINNNIQELLLDNYFPDFIINEQAEMILFPFIKIMKISEEKYLIKVNEQNFLNEIEIKNILVKDNLNRINIIKRNNDIYIYIFFLFKNKRKKILKKYI